MGTVRPPRPPVGATLTSPLPGPRACGSAALLAAARVVLLKVALLDALLTSAIMAQG